MKKILFIYLCILSFSAYASSQRDTTHKVISIHLLGYNSDEDIAELGERIPALAAEGVNLVFLEVDYNFEFVSHPELRANDHVITKKGAADFVSICKQYGIRIVPQFQSLGHQSWAQYTFALLKVYPELDLTPKAFPNNEGIYCREWDPYNPRVNEIVFPLIDEILEAFSADGLHMGMDEVFLIGSEHALSTRDRDPAEVYAKVVNDFHDYFTKKKGKQLYMWADRLIDGKKYKFGEWESSLNGTAAAVDSIPKDIVLCDWHYEPMEAYPSIPMFLEKGFKVLPCSYRKVDAVKALIKYSYQLDHPNMIGHMFTTWSVVKRDSLVYYAPLLEGMQTIKSGKFYNVTIESHTALGQDSLQLLLSTYHSQHKIRYTLDGSEPTLQSSMYAKPVKIGKTALLKAVVYNGNTLVSDVSEKKFIVHKAIGTDLTFQTQPSHKYAAKDGGKALINGLTGSASYTDGQWVGFEGQNMELIIDLGNNTQLSSLSFNTLNDTRSWVHQGDKIEMEQSGDGRVYNKMLEKDIPVAKEGIVHTSIPLKVTTRYVKLKIFCKTIPAGNPGEGNKAWLFVDEIVLE
ncbi:MAG: chitobiase/beta-hexosaminidase C-terminal domain-containing protein [Cytophagaceae bacterium]|nr:chitobiase/beta-hexosaminidase C-terminal domain-containing protein [Cytophagaceae bacterium]